MQTFAVSNHHLTLENMLYFNQIIELKNRQGRFIFKAVDAEKVTLRQGNETIIIPADEFKKEDIIELTETVKLFGRTPIKRVLRATI
jgi:hypothetical protein